MVVTNVASNLYLTFPVYVWLGTLNRLANHLPMSVNGMKLEITNDKARAIAKLTLKFTQSIVLKLIVKIPESRLDCAVIAEARHKKNDTGISHTRLYTNVASLNLGVIILSSMLMQRPKLSYTLHKDHQYLKAHQLSRHCFRVWTSCYC